MLEDGAASLRTARMLSWLIIGWNTLEGAAAVYAGVAAGSLALIGFGLDSWIEVFAAGVVLWQLRGVARDRDRLALRLIALSFFLLSAYVIGQALRDVLTGREAGESVFGIGLAAVSLVVMPALAMAQRRVGRHLGNPVVVADATQTALSFYLSAVLLAGLGLNRTVGWWWSDPLAAVGIAALAAREGWETWRGDAAASSRRIHPAVRRRWEDRRMRDPAVGPRSTSARQAGSAVGGALIVTLALLVAVLVGSAADRFTSQAMAAQGDTAQHEGERLRDPPQYVSKNGILKVRLVVERRRVELAGRRLWALTYNGSYMPPTLRVRPGDRMDLTMINRVGPYTNLHVHGLHVSPEGNSDNVFLHINEGETFHYQFRFPPNQRPGTFWYHSHAHPYSAPQVAGGMSGIIIVDGLQQHLPKDSRGITEHIIALKDYQVDGDSIRTEGLSIGAPTNRTVNGQLNPTIPIRPGETQLWRLANISANIYYRLQLQGQAFHVIAQDGNPVTRVWSADSLVIPAGARYDVLVQGGAPGQTRLETLAYDTGPAGNQFPQRNLATLVSRGKPVARSALPTTFDTMEDLSDAEIAQRRTIVFSEDDSGNTFFINGKTFDTNRVDTRSRLNTVEEWTIRNDSDEEHTFHVHTNDFQVMSINGRPNQAHSWQDTVNLPVRGNVTVRMHFTDFPGKTVYHCHILNHEDAGMMAVLEIAEP